MDGNYIFTSFNERLTKELEELYKKIERSPQISPSDLEIADTLLHSLKSLKTVMAMDSHDDNRYSGTSISSRYYRPLYSGDHMTRYSNDSEKTTMMDRLEDMMRNARSEDEAVRIKDAMDAVSRLR